MQVNYVLRPDWRFKKANDKYSFRLWVYYQAVTEEYLTVLEISKEDYEKLQTGRLNAECKDVRDKIRSIQTQLDNYLADVSDFDYDQFVIAFIRNNKLFIQRKKHATRFKIIGDETDFDYTPYEKRFRILKEEHPKTDSISVIFQFLVKKHLRHKKIGTATHYQTAYYSFKNSMGNVTFRKVTKHFLEDYKYILLEKKNTLTTVSMYTRNMRTAFNEAIFQKLIKQDKYPFGKRGFVIPEVQKTKAVIPIHAIQRIFHYTTDHEPKLFARDLWLFLYQANGMNVKDLCLLKYGNFKDTYFWFIRAKVEGTSNSHSKEVHVHITENMLATIHKYGNKKNDDNTYVFPFVSDDLTPLQLDDRIETICYIINRWMKVIFKELKIKGNSSTKHTRYAISNHLREAGASTEVIKDVLGHGSVKTTEIYLDSFRVKTHVTLINKVVKNMRKEPKRLTGLEVS